MPIALILVLVGVGLLIYGIVETISIALWVGAVLVVLGIVLGYGIRDGGWRR